MMRGVRRRLPGVVVLVFIGGVAWLLATMIPVITPLVLAIAIGALMSNTIGLPTRAAAGIGIHATLLEIGIVLLGAQVLLGPLLSLGPLILALVTGVVVLGLATVTLIARAVDLDEGLTSLLAAGSSICGISAIAAVAPICDIEDSHIAHAAATIVLFDAVTLLAFPVAAHWLGLDSQFFGIWIGLAMFSTGPVAAAGFAYSVTAGQWATVTKLARNGFIGLVALWYTVRSVDRHTETSFLRTLWDEFPWFLLGFLGMVVWANSGLMPARMVDVLAIGADGLFLLAFAGLGTELRVREMADSGVVPIAVVGVNLLLIAALTFGILTITL
ncbi:MAG: YeiH family protein [Salinirussus sp.]